ncbi:MAG: adenylate/guanylate cyclase domain-containing protein [Pseudomonadota bacterium]
MATKETPERKLAVILHADVVESTKLVQREETLAHQRITQAFRQLSETTESYRGTVHEVRGDALVAEFPRASDAVSAALAFQQRNASVNANHSDEIAPVVRVGISLGEVVIADDTVTGPGVVLAQRVEQLAEPGGVCATAAIHEAAPGRLPFEYVDLGNQSAKGFDEPVHVYAVALKSDAVLPTPLVSSAHTPKSTTRRWTILVAPAFVIALAVGGWYAWEQWRGAYVKAANPEKMAFALPDEPSIAVLPFANLRGDSSIAPLIDGLSGTLTAALAAAPRIFVIASTATAKYRGETVSPSEIAEEMGVRYVLTGSVQWANEQMRVTVQLIDAIDGKSLWGERYDRKVGDIFRVQDDIVKHILAEIEGTLVWEDSPALWADMTANLDAYLHYLKGQKALFKFTREGNETARRQAMKTIENDSEFASGWNLLGWTFYHAGRRGWGFGTRDENWAQAEEHARQAIKLSPIYGSPRGLLALIQSGRGQFQLSNETCDDAIRVAPNEAILLVICSTTRRQNGDHVSALDLVDRALRLAPRHPAWFLTAKGYAHFNGGEYLAAISALEASIARGQRHLTLRGYLAAAYHAIGEQGKASNVIKELLKDAPEITAEHLAAQNQHMPQIQTQLVQALVAAGIPERPALTGPDKPSIGGTVTTR